MAAKKKASAKKAKVKKIVVKKATSKKVAAKKPVSAKKATASKAAPKAAAKSAAKNSPAPKAEGKKAPPDLTSFMTPLDDRILVSPDEAPTKTAGGLIIPGMASERPSRGTVVAKGRGRRNKKGQIRPLDVEVGDKVLYAEYAGTKINFSNATVLILREEDILGIAT